MAWDDPDMGADWGIDAPVLSARDQSNPRRADIDPAAAPVRPPHYGPAAPVGRTGRARVRSAHRADRLDSRAGTGTLAAWTNRSSGSSSDAGSPSSASSAACGGATPARRAKVSETLWRDLETGRKEAIGAIRLLPNPSADVLERVAGALELPVEDVLARIGRPARRPAAARRPSPTTAPAAPRRTGRCSAVKLRRLSERDRAVVERLVDAMLEHEHEHG